MEKVLFITNKIFVDETKPEGGVRFCTYDFINLIKTRYDVQLFTIDFNRSFLYRLKVKLGTDVYEDYNLTKIATTLIPTLKASEIRYVFINMANASTISKIIKEEFGDKVKVILCSHGNESGDFLHQSYRFSGKMSFIRKLTSAKRLGKVLQKELELRIKFIDLVMTVSPVEEEIEKWIGAKKIFFVPRVYQPDYIEWKPVAGKAGFVSDLSHYPNYYGLLSLCESIKQIGYPEKFQLIAVGKETAHMKDLIGKYAFLKFTGYMDDDELKKEASSWMYYLNLVFYYSKGVSTKLAKGMNWGVPVISTTQGNRGYVFRNGSVITCSDAKEMADVLMKKVFDLPKAAEESKAVKKIVEAFDNYDLVMHDLQPLINLL